MRHLIILTLLVSGWGFSQSQSLRGDAMVNRLMNNTYTATRLVDDRANIDGSPYRSEEFGMGKVWFKDNPNPYIGMLRYDGQKDLFEVKLDDGKMSEIKKDPYIKILLRNEKYSLHSFQNEDQTQLGYFIELVNDENLSFFLRPHIYLKPGKPSRDGLDQAQRPRFIEKEVYYTKAPGGILKEVRLKKKDILSQLGDSKKDIETYVKNNKLNYKDPKDVAKIIAHYNAIASSAQ